MNKKILAAFALVFASVSLAAQEASNEALAFSALDYGTSSMSMAGATLTDTSNVAFAVFGNPSMLPLSNKEMDVAVSYTSLTPATYKTGVICAGAAKRFDRFGVALGFVSSTCPELGKFQEKDLILGGGIAYKFSDFLSLGVNGKLSRQSFSEKHSYSAFTADIYAGGAFGALRYSLGVDGIGGKVESGKHTYSLPASIAAGLGYSYALSADNSVQAQLDADYFFSKTFATALGVQYSYRDMLFVRGGYRIGGKSVIPSYASLGLGCKFYGISADLALLLGNSDLKNTLSFAVGFSF